MIGTLIFPENVFIFVILICFFKNFLYQFSNKNERPARLELVIKDKLNINKNGILFLDKELTSEIQEYKFYMPLL